MDTPLAPEQGIDSPTNARELAIQRLKMKQDFKGILAGGLFAVIVVVVIWALGEGGYFWPVWVMLGVVLVILQPRISARLAARGGHSREDGGAVLQGLDHQSAAWAVPRRPIGRERARTAEHPQPYPGNL